MQGMDYRDCELVVRLAISTLCRNPISEATIFMDRERREASFIAIAEKM